MKNICPNCGWRITGSTGGWDCEHCHAKYDVNGKRIINVITLNAIAETHGALPVANNINELMQELEEGE